MIGKRSRRLSRRQDIRSMANRILKLTKRAVEALKANDADTVYWDGELTGFGVHTFTRARTC